MSIKPIQKMKNETISDKRYMTYEHYINNPMQIVERRLNLVIAKNPHLIHLLNRSLCNPFKKSSHIPFNK